jgi:4-hydroxy-3-methylbut-2-enyl diphosphate reductase
MRVWLANPRGFCAGVERAIGTVEHALERHGAPVYVRHAIVHNERVVAELASKGAVFVQDVDEIPPGALTVYSAHGVPRHVERAAARRRLDVVDATCPLVAKVHRAARRLAADGCEVIVVGHAGHPEVVGTAGQVSAPVHVVATAAQVDAIRVADPQRVGYVTQTTLAVDETRTIVAALERRFPAIRGGDMRDICYASQNRQAAARELAARCGLVVVLGSPRSSNAARLREVVMRAGTLALQVGDASELVREWFAGVDDVGITAGASTPESVVAGAVDRLQHWFACSVHEVPGRAEDVVLPLPARFATRSAAPQVSA